LIQTNLTSIANNTVVPAQALDFSIVIDPNSIAHGGIVNAHLAMRIQDPGGTIPQLVTNFRLGNVLLLNSVTPVNDGWLNLSYSSTMRGSNSIVSSGQVSNNDTNSTLANNVAVIPLIGPQAFSIDFAATDVSGGVIITVDSCVFSICPVPFI